MGEHILFEVTAENNVEIDVEKQGHIILVFFRGGEEFHRLPRGKSVKYEKTTFCPKKNKNHYFSKSGTPLPPPQMTSL